MKTLSDNFRQAVGDYLWMLNRHYPQKAIIKLIGDRYKLSGTERSMLYRGICATNEAKTRQAKLTDKASLKSQSIHIDAYNVLITIGSYLNGNAVFISNDYFLRDASEIHGKVLRTGLIQRALKLTLEFLRAQEPAFIQFYLDSPVSHSGKLSQEINELFLAYNMRGSVETHPSPDYLLKNVTTGIIATSDSTIIDKTMLPVIDLPRHVLEFHFEPEFYDLREIDDK